MQASYGPLMAADCMVLGGDVKDVVCGSATDFLVQPHDALSRTIPHQQALSATVTGERYHFQEFWASGVDLCGLGYMRTSAQNFGCVQTGWFPFGRTHEGIIR